MGIISKLNIKHNPFEHYVAENEKNIDAYAIRPPYLEYIDSKVNNKSSFILFGDRGAGKSATRITLYRNFWQKVEQGEQEIPFVVNFIDFTRIHSLTKNDKLTDYDIVQEVAYSTLEQLVIWLTTLDSEDREDTLESLSAEERRILITLLRAFYLNVSEADREQSNEQALQAISSTLYEKSGIWTRRNWTGFKETASIVLATIFKLKNKADHDEIKVVANGMLSTFDTSEFNSSRAIISKLKKCIKSFGFSGVTILVDKLDETESTSNSVEKTAKLIYPILAHIQLLEIPDFAWVIFIWENVRRDFNNGALKIRLDKIAHKKISWKSNELLEMVERRIDYYSEGKLAIYDLFDESLDYERKKFLISTVVEISNKSPRELIRIFDIILREHDYKVEESDDYEEWEKVKLDEESVNQGLDIYCLENIEHSYDPNILDHVYRLGKTEITSSDIAFALKISSNAANSKIAKWKETGLIKKISTVSNNKVGKPSNKYKITDYRIVRIIERNLTDTVGVPIE